MRAVIAAAAASTLLLPGRVGRLPGAGLQEFDEVDTGEALHEVAEPGDTLVVFGGRADLQLTSGMASPYEHLWSLPTRTIGPRLADLQALVSRPGRAHLARRVGRRSTTWSDEYGAELAGPGRGALRAARRRLRPVGRRPAAPSGC